MRGIASPTTRAPKSAPLRLDREEFAFEVRDTGTPVIVKGDPVASEFVRRLRTTDPDDLMPPAKSHKVMKPEEIALLDHEGRGVTTAGSIALFWRDPEAATADTRWKRTHDAILPTTESRATFAYVGLDLELMATGSVPDGSSEDVSGSA